LLADLAQSGHIAGVKDSSGDLAVLTTYRRALPGAVLVGSAALLLAALELGCDGGILAVACFAPTLCGAVWEAVNRGDLSAAALCQARLAPLQDIVTRFGPPGVKAAMDMAGVEGGPCRAPLQSLGPADREYVRRVLGG
jgi:4-hydroxy-2-oxoglutarate aldolase